MTARYAAIISHASGDDMEVSLRFVMDRTVVVEWGLGYVMIATAAPAECTDCVSNICCCIVPLVVHDPSDTIAVGVILICCNAMSSSVCDCLLSNITGYCDRGSWYVMKRDSVCICLVVTSGERMICVGVSVRIDGRSYVCVQSVPAHAVFGSAVQVLE